MSFFNDSLERGLEGIPLETTPFVLLGSEKSFAGGVRSGKDKSGRADSAADFGLSSVTPCCFVFSTVQTYHGSECSGEEEGKGKEVKETKTTKAKRSKSPCMAVSSGEGVSVKSWARWRRALRRPLLLGWVLGRPLGGAIVSQ